MLSNLQISASNVLGLPAFFPGNALFVSSVIGSNDNPGDDKEFPFATIDYAIGKCRANKGDVIYVLPGHTETISAAGGIAADVAGITIIGLGTGGLRPVITLGTLTTASFTVSAANVSIHNMIFTSALDNVATVFTVTGKDCTINACDFIDASSSLHFYSCILTGTTDNGADGLTITNCFRLALAAGALAFISILGNCDRAKITDNIVDSAGTGDVGHFMIMAAKVMLGARILRNVCNIVGAAGATVGVFMTGSSTTSTGVVANNYVFSLDTTGALFCTATLTFGLFENYYTGAVNASGALWPAADTPS